MGYCFLISLGSGSFSILGFFWPIGDFAYHSVYLELIVAGFEEDRERERERERVIGEIFWFSVL